MVSATELHELFKLPILLEHFAEHKAQNNELSLWEFFAMHYAQEFDHDANDKKLPFKNHQSNTASFVAVFFAPYKSVKISNPIDFIQSEVPVYVAPHVLLTIVSSIWQPPRA